MALDLCYIVFDGGVFIALLHWGVNYFLQSLNDLFDFIFWCILSFYSVGRGRCSNSSMMVWSMACIACV